MAARFLESNFESKYDEKLAQTVSVATTMAENLVFSGFGKKKPAFRKKPKQPSLPITLPKKLLLDKKTRDEQTKEHKQKAKHTKNFVAKQIYQQKEIQKRIEERNKMLNEKIDREIEQEKLKKEEENKTKMELKFQKIEEAKTRNEARREQISLEIQTANRNYAKTKKNIPLYEKIEENYRNEQLMPELEQKKAFLAKKRMLAQTHSINELLEHARKHDQQIIQSAKIRKRQLFERNIESKIYINNIPKSRFHLEVIEEQKQKAITEEQKEEHKKQLLKKKQNYSELVKEMYEPSLDVLKQKEIELMKEKISARVPKSQPEKSIESETFIKKRVWKKNDMIPEVVPKREGKIVDYLAEERSKREGKSLKFDWEKELTNVELNESERNDKVRAIADSIEKKALEKEGKVGGLKDPKSIQEAEAMSDMLVNSIKAKLAILEDP